jgi:hypothetical protein
MSRILWSSDRQPSLFVRLDAQKKLSLCEDTLPFCVAARRLSQHLYNNEQHLIREIWQKNNLQNESRLLANALTYLGCATNK